MAQAPKPDDTQPVVPLDEAFVPPSAQSGGADSVRLEMRVDELERRLKARTLELETEIRGKERLRSRIEELTRRISELEETASCLHREAVSATALSQELDETLRVASEARRHLGSALEAERGRREAAENDLGGLRRRLAEAQAQHSRDEADVSSARAEVSDLRAQAQQAALAQASAAEELKRVRWESSEAAESARSSVQALASERVAREAAERGLADARLKIEESKRLEGELRDVRRMVQASRQKLEGHEAHIESLRSEVSEARRLEQEAEKYCTDLEARVLEAEEKARAVMENAETIRREGVEAFEKSREAALGLQLKEDKFRRESAGLEALKTELRARADRELAEMRRSLDSERERMRLDLEAERLGAQALGRGGEAPSERFQRLHAESQERRREISREAQEYTVPQTAAPAPVPVLAPVAAADTEPPSSREPWQVSDELRLLLWVAIGVGLVATMVASVLFLQG